MGRDRGKVGSEVSGGGLCFCKEGKRNGRIGIRSLDKFLWIGIRGIILHVHSTSGTL